MYIHRAKHVRQDELNVEVIQLVKYVFGGENDMKDQILQKLDSDDSLRELLAEKERLTKEREKLSSKKSKLMRRIADLDIDDKLYDDLMKTYRESVNEVNEQINIMENQLYQNDLAIENAEGENLSTEVYKRIIDEMLDNIDDMNDADKKTLMNLLIEKIEIYPEKQKDGRWIKSVQFKIPLNIDGKAVDTLFFDDEEDTENSLPTGKHVDAQSGAEKDRPQSDDGRSRAGPDFNGPEGKQRQYFRRGPKSVSSSQRAVQQNEASAY